MSESFDAAGTSPSWHPLQSQASIKQPATSQLPSVSVTGTSTSTVTSPEHRPRALHVSTILNPSPDSNNPSPHHGYHPYDASHRRSGVQAGSPTALLPSSMTSSFASGAGVISHPSSPIGGSPRELDRRLQGHTVGRGPRYSNDVYNPPSVRHPASARPRPLRGSGSSSFMTPDSSEATTSPLSRHRRASSLASLLPGNHPDLTSTATRAPPVSNTLEPPMATQPPRPYFPQLRMPPGALTAQTSMAPYTPSFPITGATYGSSQSSYGADSLSAAPTAGQPLPGDFAHEMVGGRPALPRGPVAGQDIGTYPMSLANGMTVNVPIDTTKASKNADEKRARNARASARFRKNRNKKEQALKAQNTDLDTENKTLKAENNELRMENNELRTERQGLLSERDYWRNAALTGRTQTGEGAQHEQQQQQQPPIAPSIFTRSETQAPTYGPVPAYAPIPGNFPGPERLESVTGLGLLSRHSSSQQYGPATSELPGPSTLSERPPTQYTSHRPEPRYPPVNHPGGQPYTQSE